MDEKTLSKRLRELEEEMMSYAKNLDFEKAARVREELMALRKQAFGASAPAWTSHNWVYEFSAS